MIYFFQSLSLKVRFLGVLVLGFPVLAFQWLLMSAPWSLARLRLLASGAGLPDSLFWYDPPVLRGLFASWGDDGRLQYLTVIWPTDTGFLLAYGAFLTAAVLYLLKKANPAGPWWYLLPLLPLAGAGADFLENATVALASVAPSDWDAVGWVAGGLTAAKWSLLGLTAAVLVFGTAVHLVRQAASRFRASAPLILEKAEPEEPSKN